MIIIDPGHGGMIDGVYQTKGKMYDHGDFIFYEGVFNRQLAKRIGLELEGWGIDYEIIAGNRDDSLSTRTRRANSIGKLHDCIYLSIHGNAAGTESANGMEIFTSPGQTESDIVATFLYDSLKGMGWKMRSDYSDGDVDKESRFYVLMKTNMPAILIEYGFFTNREEAKRMMNLDVQDKLAKLTVQGIRRYYEETKS